MTETAQEVWQSDDGEYLAFDGVFYSFANADGQGIKLWVPPVEGPIRGVILHGNPGGGFGGDTRSKTRQRDLQEFAARQGFAVAGVTGFPGRATYSSLAAVVLRAFELWGAHGAHPELAHLPFIATGGSNAGMFSFGMMCFAPDRAIGITPNCGPVYSAEVTDAARKVPAWMHVGAVDPLIPTGVENTEELYREHAPRGVLWAWDAEIKGHENGSSDHIDFAYWDAIIPLRLPPTVDPGKPVKLMPIDRETGWWVDHRSWDHTIAKVAPETKPKPFESEKGRYGWVPDEGIARIYQATASRQRVIKLSLVDPATTEGGQTSGVFLSSGGSLVARPGEQVQVRLELGNMVRGMREVDIYDRAEKLGVLDLRQGPVFTFTVDGSKRVYSLHARATGRRGVERTSNPVQVIVSDPEVSGKIDRQLASTSLAKRFQANAAANANFDRLARDDGDADRLGDDAIGAARLTDAQASSLSADGKLSRVWGEVQAVSAPKRIDASHAADGEGPQSMDVQGAYGKDGLYLLFSVTDPTWSARATDPLAGALDFHIASISTAKLRGAEPGPDLYAFAMAYSLLRNALQIQIPVAGDLDGDKRIAFNYWDPWDPTTFRTSSATNYDGMGLWIDRFARDDGSRCVELFLPWALVGNPGLRSMPPAGSGLAVMLGYNPRGDGARPRWPYGKDPWAEPAKDRRSGQRTPVYGEIVLLK
jgi:hypothetical protein